VAGDADKASDFLIAQFVEDVEHTIFSLNLETGRTTILHSFAGGPADGAVPYSGVTPSGANLYGTTELFGRYYCGTVFKLAPDGTGTVLYAFASGSDGGRPYAGVIRDSAGNLYGTASRGGTGDCSGKGMGCGVVFEIKE
jgi:uncharacterized repeat protein (TIGR03803 family)